MGTELELAKVFVTLASRGSLHEEMARQSEAVNRLSNAVAAGHFGDFVNHQQKMAAATKDLTEQAQLQAGALQSVVDPLAEQRQAMEQLQKNLESGALAKYLRETEAIKNVTQEMTYAAKIQAGIIPSVLETSRAEKFFHAMGKVKGVADEVTKSFRTMLPLVVGLGVVGTASILKMVEVANPAVFQQLTFSIRDLSGVIGQQFAPYVAVAAGILRKIADTVYAMPASFKALTAALVVAGVVGVTTFTLLTAAATAFAIAVTVGTGGLNLALAAIAGLVSVGAGGFGALAAVAATTKTSMEFIGRLFNALAESMVRIDAALSRMGVGFSTLGSILQSVVSIAFQELIGFVQVLTTEIIRSLSYVQALGQAVAASGGKIELMVVNLMMLKGWADHNFQQMIQDGNKAAANMPKGAPAFGGQASFSDIASARQRISLAALNASVGADPAALQREANGHLQRIAQNTNSLPGMRPAVGR